MQKEIILPFVFKRICPCYIFNSNVKCWKNNLQLSVEKILYSMLSNQSQLVQRSLKNVPIYRFNNQQTIN
jgi:hypothetical protein